MYFTTVLLASLVTITVLSAALETFQTTQCGPLAGNQTCSSLNFGGGACCSAWGWCGSDEVYCSTGCQPAFSEPERCTSTGRISEGPKEQPNDESEDKGKAENKGEDKSQPLPTAKPTQCPFKTGAFLDTSCYTQEMGQQCGPKDGGCQFDLCCSGAGWCGKGPEYCSVPGNCQQEFGTCDSWNIPKIIGHNVRDDKRQFDDSFPAVVNACKETNHLALSFDDGPTNYTIAILDLLKQYEAHATFFLAGNINGRGAIDTDHKTTVKRMLDEGHQIGSHTWSHPILDSLTSAQRKEEMYNNDQAIYNVIGKYPTFMRPPEVKCGPECEKDMRDLGYHVAMWQVDSQDWMEKRPNLESTKVRLGEELILHAPQHGMFLIQHDTHGEAIEVARSLLDLIKTRNLPIKSTTLAECLGLAKEKAYQGGKTSHD